MKRTKWVGKPIIGIGPTQLCLMALCGPWLSAERHCVTVRIGVSLASNGQPIAVDIPIPAGKIELIGLCDAQTWIKNEIDRAKAKAVALWVSGLAKNADRANLRVYLASKGA